MGSQTLYEMKYQIILMLINVIPQYVFWLLLYFCSAPVTNVEHKKKESWAYHGPFVHQLDDVIGFLGV